MERLSKDRREELRNKIKRLYMEASDYQDENECAYCVSELEWQELVVIKYRIASCIKLLQEYGLAEPLKELEIPDIGSMFLSYTYTGKSGIFEKEDWFDFLSIYINSLVGFAEEYMEKLLENTEWKIFYISELKEYESLPRDVLEKLNGAIEMHWEALNESYSEDQISEHLSSMGFKPCGYYDFYPTYNLVLLNNNIKRMIEICEKDKEYKTWDEYKEFEKLKTFYLLDRFFPEVSNRDMNDPSWCCISYLFGEVMTHRVEECGLYQLNYEAVLYLLLADMAASVFLEKYQREGQGKAA